MFSSIPLGTRPPVDVRRTSVRPFDVTQISGLRHTLHVVEGNSVLITDYNFICNLQFNSFIHSLNLPASRQDADLKYYIYFNSFLCNGSRVYFSCKRFVSDSRTVWSKCKHWNIHQPRNVVIYGYWKWRHQRHIYTINIIFFNLYWI